MKNIVLIGMPGSGKSTLGVILAKTLGVEFIDTDILIQKTKGRLLQDMIEQDGITAFLDIERDTILSLNVTNTVVATGGSAVLREQSMQHLKNNGVIVWLSLPCSIIERRVNNITTRGIAAKKGEDIRDIYRARQPFYEKYCDIEIDCKGNSVEKNVSLILKKLIETNESEPDVLHIIEP